MLINERIFNQLDLTSGRIEQLPLAERKLSDLKGSFIDEAAFHIALKSQDSLVYTVCSVEAPPEAGQLNYALGKILPGKIGKEYFFTKGHFHAWRPAAEVYLGLAGEGMMLLEAEEGGEENASMFPLLPHSIVYVPGNTAHRTVNVGHEPLVYIGIYPAQAGHDYDSLARRNFRHVILELDGRPALVERKIALEKYLHGVGEA